MKTITIIGLIRNECSNYFPDSSGSGRIKNYCCLKDKSCNFFNPDEPEQLPRCSYFEKSVLPLNKELEFKYKKERKLNTLNSQRYCKQCLESFIPKSNKQKFCDKCITIRRKEKSRLRMQAKRKAS